MRLHLQREAPTLDISKGKPVTFGALYLNGIWQCWTLEDAVRQPKGQEVPKEGADHWVREWKIPKETAIPYGTYPLSITDSARFKKPLPLVGGVAGFTGIRIHAGNTIEDTEGCILVGQVREASRILSSRLALEALLSRLRMDVSAHTLTLLPPYV